MDKKDIERISLEVERENSLFSSKSQFDTMTFPPSIVGREEKARELVRFLMGYKKDHVVPFISVYGRSGSGKSTVVRFVLENLEGISYAFVNLRKAKTVFGCANLILAELGEPNLKSAQGINLAIERISAAIESVLEKKNHKLFVLVLDEFDVLFYDTRGKPSDFIYKLLVMEEKLKEKSGYMLCIVAVSNNVMAEYEIDDRVRSRIGSSEIFFNPYRKQNVVSILKDRAEKALAEKVDDQVIDRCAELSSQEHGDARRAVDLLRVAAEMASSKGEKLAVAHVDLASEQLQKERVNTILSASSYHLKLACAGLARIEFLTERVWHSTSTLYNQYSGLVAKDTKALTYRRFSELLTELVNTGLAVSQTSSKGRYGYGTQYKLVVPPEMVGTICFPQWWKNLVQRKREHESEERERKIRKRRDKDSIFGKPLIGGLSAMLDEKSKAEWDEFVGLE